MKFKDCQIAGVSRNKFSEMVVKIKIKPDDYQLADYVSLHNLWEEGVASDVDFQTAADSTAPTVDKNTGEVS